MISRFTQFKKDEETKKLKHDEEQTRRNVELEQQNEELEHRKKINEEDDTNEGEHFCCTH